MGRQSHIGELVSVDVEHMLGLRTGLPLVKLRTESNNVVLVGQLTTAQARQIAGDLMAAAARAEYEYDFFIGAKAVELPESTIGAVLHIVRKGEVQRCTMEIGENDRLPGGQ